MKQELEEAMKKYLNCSCQVFPAMSDDMVLMEAYHQARKEGEQEGYLPVMIVPDDYLWESLIWNTRASAEGDRPYGFQNRRVSSFRKKILTERLEDGKQCLKLLRAEQEEATEVITWQKVPETAGRERSEESVAVQEERAEGIVAVQDEASEAGEIMTEEERELMQELLYQGLEVRGFISFWDDTGEKTCPMILAKIPVKHPWEVFAWLPFGGWNHCPDTLDMMAVAKYWYKRYGAVPAVVTHDVLEFELPQPAGKEDAKELAEEHYAFCSDTIDQALGGITLTMLGQMLDKTTKWYFCWE